MEIWSHGTGVPRQRVLKVYPNPASDHLVLEFKNWGGLVELRITDLSGKVVKQKLIDSSDTYHILDISEIKVGTYSIVIHTLANVPKEQKQIEIVR